MGKSAEGDKDENNERNTKTVFVLGVETSGQTASIALCEDGRLLEERRLEEGRRQLSRTLVTAVGELLAAHGVEPRECGVVGVSVGPGSFTGLRIGVVFAKAFAFAAGGAVCGIDTLQCVAEAAPSQVRRVYVVSDALRGELYVAEYEKEEGSETWSRCGRLLIEKAETWAAARRADEVVTGPGLERFRELLEGRCQLLPPTCWHPQAAVVARLAWRRWQAGTSDSLWELEPLYVRKSYAEEKNTTKNF